MKRSLSILILIVIAVSCTKEVPEGTKKVTKSADEINAAKTVEGFFSAYNSNDIEKAISFCDPEFKEVVPDSDDVVKLDGLRNDLLRYKKQYSDGKWEVSIEEVTVSGDMGYVMTKGSFMMPGVGAAKLNPVYSERSIRILKRQKDGKWKIFRYIAVPIFTYDND
ncbi:MAG: nuclear transport factor 2 family protein [Bacteroidetes bacterium]|nr:nuclear transport factor 2 family protein [Bacteroidota bacterium]MCL6100150.1 nuclear transport factor 2 family protein [Bacteroidota bacterium]